MRSEISKEIGKALVTIGLAVAGATIAYMIQFENLKTRMLTVEEHTKKSHPPHDYRELQSERIEDIRKDFERHERDHKLYYQP